MVRGVTAPARPARGLYVGTILVGSFLLFLIQPMVARMALPRLGGAPNVWNSAMLVYQSLLLAGYWYAHRLSRLPLQRQARIHLGLFIVAALTLPVGLVDLLPPRPGFEALWVPALLALSIGPVFFLVSAQAPLMQRWFAYAPGAGEPWALYAASNFGSFAGLIAYPLLAEPLLPLGVQAWGWSAGYGLLGLLVLLSARARRGILVPDEAADAAMLPRRQLLLWIALAAVPSGLMLSTTTHLTTDLFAMPLLWVIPLGIYLLTFVIAFADRRGPARTVAMLAWPALLGIGGTAMVSHGSHGLVPVIAAVALLFFVCVALHARLYDLRPATGHLTTFYLAMSAGGALGGLFTALLAPLLFDWVWEHPLLIFAAAALMPLDPRLDWRRLGGLGPELVRLGLATVTLAILFFGWQLYQARQYVDSAPTAWHFTVPIVLLGLTLVPWRWAASALLLALMLIQGGFETIDGTLHHIRTRSYFGIYTVRDYPVQRLRTLAHGTTLHGEQSTDPRLSRVPLTYYGPGAGAAIVFSHADRLWDRPAQVGVLGLGTGTLACFARPGQRWTVFEIDPAVVRLSTGGTFTYLSQCAPTARIVLGDARLKLAQLPAAGFDLLAIDAFSSDSVPLHLFTDEAFGIYLRALSPTGVMMVHISNRFIDLEPALSAELRARGLAAAVRDDLPDENSEWSPSTWVAVSRDPAQITRIKALAPQRQWREVGRPAPRLWRDDHASILPYVTWANFLGKR